MSEDSKRKRRSPLEQLRDGQRDNILLAIKAIDALNKEREGLVAQSVTLTDKAAKIADDKAATQTMIDEVDERIDALTQEFGTLDELNAKLAEFGDA